MPLTRRVSLSVLSRTRREKRALFGALRWTFDDSGARDMGRSRPGDRVDDSMRLLDSGDGRRLTQATNRRPTTQLKRVSCGNLLSTSRSGVSGSRGGGRGQDASIVDDSGRDEVSRGGRGCGWRSGRAGHGIGRNGRRPARQGGGVGAKAVKYVVLTAVVGCRTRHGCLVGVICSVCVAETV